MKKQTLYWVIAVCITAFCVFTTIETSTYGAEVNQLENKQVSLQDEGADLNRELIKASSLGSISGKAESLGFIKPEGIVYVSREPEFAAR